MFFIKLVNDDDDDGDDNIIMEITFGDLHLWSEHETENHRGADRDAHAQARQLHLVKVDDDRYEV